MNPLGIPQQPIAPPPMHIIVQPQQPHEQQQQQHQHQPVLPEMMMMMPQHVAADGTLPGVPFGTRPTNKRHWLLSDQVAKIEEAFVRWNGNWRGKEPQLQALAAELGIKVEKLKKRVDYMRRSREAKAQREQDTTEGLKGLAGDMLDSGDDGSFSGTKRARLSEGGFFGMNRIQTEPYNPPKCLFTHNGCQSTPEQGQIMTVFALACGHRFVCLDCFNYGFNLEQYLSKTASCPTCREGTLTSKEGFLVLQELDKLKQPCKWCRVKNHNMVFMPCGHISDYCTECFENVGSGFNVKEEVCTQCEQKFQKVLEV